jgi:hypothetical protein
MKPTLTAMDDPHPSRTAYVGGLFVLIFVLVVIALVGYFNRVATEEFEVKVVDQAAAAPRELRAAQLSRIREYRWVDRQAGVVAIPIERAMELIVEEHSRSPHRGGGS